jgi:hypothetical protein
MSVLWKTITRWKLVVPDCLELEGSFNLDWVAYLWKETTKDTDHRISHKTSYKAQTGNKLFFNIDYSGEGIHQLGEDGLWSGLMFQFSINVKLSLCLGKSHAMKTCRGVELCSRWRWFVSFTPNRFTPEKIATGTHWIGSWVTLRPGLDAVAKRKNPFIAPVENRTPVVQPVASSLYWLSYPASRWARWNCLSPTTSRERGGGTVTFLKLISPLLCLVKCLNVCFCFHVNYFLHRNVGNMFHLFDAVQQ